MRNEKGCAPVESLRPDELAQVVCVALRREGERERVGERAWANTLELAELLLERCGYSARVALLQALLERRDLREGLRVRLLGREFREYRDKVVASLTPAEALNWAKGLSWSSRHEQVLLVLASTRSEVEVGAALLDRARSQKRERQMEMASALLVNASLDPSLLGRVVVELCTGLSSEALWDALEPNSLGASAGEKEAKLWFGVARALGRGSLPIELLAAPEVPTPALMRSVLSMGSWDRAWRERMGLDRSLSSVHAILGRLARRSDLSRAPLSTLAALHRVAASFGDEAEGILARGMRAQLRASVQARVSVESGLGMPESAALAADIEGGLPEKMLTALLFDAVAATGRDEPWAGMGEEALRALLIQCPLDRGRSGKLALTHWGERGAWELRTDVEWRAEVLACRPAMLEWLELGAGEASALLEQLSTSGRGHGRLREHLLELLDEQEFASQRLGRLLQNSGSARVETELAEALAALALRARSGEDMFALVEELQDPAGQGGLGPLRVAASVLAVDARVESSAAG